MTRIIYTLLYYLLSPFMIVRWFIKSLKPPQYREPFRQRFGFVANHKKTDIWFHAVSMGETSGAISIIKKLLANQPHLKIVVTTTTPTGAKLLSSQLAERVTHYYSPCDLPGTIHRFIKSVKPSLVVIMETELWPNWLYYLNKKKIPVILANARLSQSSANSYSKLAKASQQLFSHLSTVLAVNQADAERYQNLGVAQDKIRVMGNLKFDAEFILPIENDYFPLWTQQEKIWVAASTHAGEDEIILSAHKQLLKTEPHAKLILVPRHPERFEQVASLIAGSELSLSRRSQPDKWNSESQVLLGDSMGELLKAYDLSTIAFIAGSFVKIGGHNAIEAAFLSKPIISGPDVHNFQYLFDALVEAGAAKIVANSEQLATLLEDWFKQPQLVLEIGARAKVFVDKNHGALDKTVAFIQQALEIDKTS